MISYYISIYICKMLTQSYKSSGFFVLYKSHTTITISLMIHFLRSKRLYM